MNFSRLATMRGTSYCIRLPRWRGGGESRQRRTRGLDAQERWIGVERQGNPPRVGQLRDETDIGEGRQRAMAERTGRRVGSELCLEGREPQLDPVPIPVVLRLFARSQ